MDSELLVIGLLVIIIIAGVVYHFWSRKKIHNKIGFMLEAIDNRDFSFRYPTKSSNSQSAKMFNQTLNRIVQVVGGINDEIRNREQYFEKVINVVNTGILVIDDKDYVLQCNEAIAELLNMKVLTHLEQLARIEPELPSKIRGLSAGEHIIVSIQKGTSRRSISLQCTNTVLRGQQVRVLVFNDIQRELDNKELESWEKLSRVLTHEIMNSVTPLTSLADTLVQKSEETTPEIAQGLTTISKTGKSLIEFVENYRKMAHVPKPQPGIFYVKPFIEQMKGLAEHQIEGASANISVSVEPSDLLVYADEGLICRVVINILKNALQAVAEKGEEGIVEVRAEVSKTEQVVITISNNGPVIPVEEEEQIFVPFYTTKRNGSGIGLALSRRIMKESGGELLLQVDRKRGITSFLLLFS